MISQANQDIGLCHLVTKLIRRLRDQSIQTDLLFCSTCRLIIILPRIRILELFVVHVGFILIHHVDDAAKTITAYSLHIIFHYHQSHPITQPPCYDAHHRQISGAPRAVSPRSPPLKQIHGSTHDSMIVPINTAQKKRFMHVS